MAEAAKTQAQWTKYQVRLTILEIAALAVVIFLTVRATNAAVEANRITSNNAKTELRAYISLAPGGVLFDMPNQRLLLYVVQSNKGQTPAKNCRFSAVSEAFPYPLPDGEKLPEPDFREAKNTISSGASFSTQAIFADFDGVGDAHRMALIQERVYVFCVMTYEDVFGDKHRTRACWSFNLKGGHVEAAKNAVTDVPFEFPNRHNDEC